MFLILKKSTLIASALIMTLGVAGEAFAAGGPSRTNGANNGPVRTNPGSGLVRVNPNTDPVRVNPTQLPAGNGTVGIPFTQNCYTGFNRGPKVMKNPTMIDYYICYSNTISCPAYWQSVEKRWANVTPKVIVKMIGGNPDSGQAKRFQIQYKCDYEPNYKPVP